MKEDLKVYAIYLPQFHPTPQNDEWWGKGFTEWTNVTKAKPLFDGHYQPRLPSDLGFYDLRLAEAREAQAALARRYGIGGFCYYHYWFRGERLLERPFNDVLETGKPDFPFMLFWANETWSRRWLGEEREVLLKQTYSAEDDEAHAAWLCDKAFSDARYIRIAGRPAFIIYRPHDLPDYRRTIETFKRVARQKGLEEPFMIGSNSHSSKLGGFDHVINFEPQLSLLPDAFVDGRSLRKTARNLAQGVLSMDLKIYDYSRVKQIMRARTFDYPYLPSVFVGWDNSARRGRNGIVVRGQSKAGFKTSLAEAKALVQSYPEEHRIVFINAWNEWAEGNHLEPCAKFGHSFLEAVQEVVAH